MLTEVSDALFSHRVLCHCTRSSAWALRFPAILLSGTFFFFYADRQRARGINHCRVTVLKRNRKSPSYFYFLARLSIISTSLMLVVVILNSLSF